ncbi:uncharacterized protein CELE_F21C10.13 [Caenorhabditis elegans]|uniref:Uncharacterized protein n=1 Tax=Caenorhabditis elegans TaxID=6239 RepID=D7SFL5_CAEEL|nr:Uncharacterized protein CELE_F21C10.13 [Caenorhabditis elegans]CCD61445.1 Uncharacterized protein CELE_F21C10.13 [Caenorhabditis elegans]|eukprot:NP_001256114.1 Uncharacterized protein CELE_F21C10.13 [Caenorhabditis elegans]
MKVILLLCTLAIFGISSHHSPLGHKTESLEFKLALLKVESFDRQGIYLQRLFSQASERHSQEVLELCYKWGSIIIMVTALIHCAYVVLRELIETRKARREAEARQKYEERIFGLTRRLEVILNHERFPFAAGREHRARFPTN